MPFGTGLLDHVGFPTPEMLGPAATEDEIRGLIDRHGVVFVKTFFRAGVGRKGKAGLIGDARDPAAALAEKKRLYFTTTIAQYLAASGWGTTTLVSSGKDVCIHYAARDFAIALKNDARSKAVVLYVEPSGYYEHGVDFGKPVVACVVGRWKTKLTRTVGHAGAMAESGDSADARAFE